VPPVQGIVALQRVCVAGGLSKCCIAIPKIPVRKIWFSAVLSGVIFRGGQKNIGIRSIKMHVFCNVYIVRFGVILSLQQTPSVIPSDTVYAPGPVV